MRSSSISRSKRNDGGVTTNDWSSPCASRTCSRPRRPNTSAISSAAIGTPITLRARETRIRTGLRSGSAVIVSSIGPGLPPQIARTSAVMRSMCSTVVAKSTPRSKRCPASVVKLKRRARPWIAAGHQNAASTKMFLVVSETAVGSPPMMPASASTPASSAITPTRSSTSTVWPFSSFTRSPRRPQRTTRPPYTLSRSKMCDGRPSSSIT